jgi:hypothetical protein
MILMQGGESSQSATVVEQVQDSFSHIYIPIDPSVSSNSPFGSNYNYQPSSNPPEYPYHPPPPPPPSQHDEGPHTETPHVPAPNKPPEFHWTSVAIHRYTPEYIFNPPPPPSPPPIVDPYPNSETQSSHHHTFQAPHESHDSQEKPFATENIVHSDKSDKSLVEEEAKESSDVSSVGYML